MSHLLNQVEEAEHLTSLITCAHDNGITFYYALSPGLDITYSSSKEVLTLKRKLEQVFILFIDCYSYTDGVRFKNNFFPQLKDKISITQIINVLFCITCV